MAAKPVVLETKAKEILIAVWEASNTSYPTSGDALDYVIADTFSATQDDPTEQTFEFETSDAPETKYTAGAYKVNLNNADLSEDFMTKIMGWVKVKLGTTASDTNATEGVVAPEAYETRYVALQIKMSENRYYFIPKIAIAPKLVMESVKTNLVHGTLNGTATNTEVEGFYGEETTKTTRRTAIGRFNKPILTKTAAA